MRGLFFLVFAISLLGSAHAADPVPPAHPSPPIDFAHLPWTDGERLTYLVSWGGLSAAEGVFVARERGDHWNFQLSLASRGVVNSIYPFTGNFWCILAQAPWRSIQYGEFRFEPHRTIKEQTLIDYAKRQGTRQRWDGGKGKTFTIDQPAIDDVGTMLYHLRAGPWKPGDKRTLYVYESNSEKQGEAECQARETRGFGTWPAQPVLRLSMKPTLGTHRRGHLTLWMTDDARRLPLHAELEFKYGTFDLDLIKAEKTRAPGP
jgi:hypothetical protein